MTDRFVITGSGRCGTKYLSNVLTAVGVKTYHETAFSASTRNRWPGDAAGEASWMASTMLESISCPVVLLVRHPLEVVRSWVEIGFFGRDLDNPTHDPLRHRFPSVYGYEHPADRALAQWYATTAETLRRAEVMIRLELFGPETLQRLTAWAGRPAPLDLCRKVFAESPPVNHHQRSRRLTGVTWDPREEKFDASLEKRAKILARTLGYPW